MRGALARFGFNEEFGIVGRSRNLMSLDMGRRYGLFDHRPMRLPTMTFPGNRIADF